MGWKGGNITGVGHGEGEYQVQVVRGREAHLSSIAIPPGLAFCHLRTAAALSHRHWVEGRSWGVVLHQLAVFTLGRGEEKPVCERRRHGEGREAVSCLLDACFVLGGLRATLWAEHGATVRGMLGHLFSWGKMLGQ